jgi:hypothetical protein
MERDIAELENTIESAIEWKTKQWQLLSEQAIHTHHSKTVFFYETFAQYSKAKERADFFMKDKKNDDLINFKVTLIAAAIIIGIQLVLNHIFDYREKDKTFENVLIFMFLFLLVSSWVREIIFTIKMSSNESMISFLERDLLACGLSWQFLKKLMRYNEIFDDTKQDEYEALSEQEKHRINLRGHLKDFCISAAILSTFCNDHKLIEPPRDIRYNGTFF